MLALRVNLDYHYTTRAHQNGQLEYTSYQTIISHTWYNPIRCYYFVLHISGMKQCSCVGSSLLLKGQPLQTLSSACMKQSRNCRTRPHTIIFKMEQYHLSLMGHLINSLSASLLVVMSSNSKHFLNHEIIPKIHSLPLVYQLCS